MIDPMTLETTEIPSYMFFKTPFKLIAGAKQLTNCTVMDVEINYDTMSHGTANLSKGDTNVSKSSVPDAKRMKTEKRFGPHSDNRLLADVWVIRTSNLGKQKISSTPKYT